MKRIGFAIVFSVSLFANDVESLKKEVCENIREIAGWCSSEKASEFIDLVLAVKPLVCAEIGVYTGASLYPVAAALQYLGQGVVLAIDPWDKIECIRYYDPDLDRAHLKWWAHINMDHVYFGFLNVLRCYDLEETCIIFRCTSKKAAAAIGEIDILYLDGNHCEKIALADVQLYLPKIRNGGYLWFNDARWASLQPAVEYVSQFCDIVKTIEDGNCVLFKKRS